jgi:hypothetical protein
MTADLLNKQHDEENALMVEGQAGEELQNLVFKGKIQNIWLNKDQELEIEFDQGDQKHVTVPLKDQIR